MNKIRIIVHNIEELIYSQDQYQFLKDTESENLKILSPKLHKSLFNFQYLNWLNANH